jgi:hypothetical protein
MYFHLVLLELLSLLGVVAANSYFALALHAPKNAMLNGKIINARDRSFIIGAPSPSTRCDLNDPAQCPAGDITLINGEMSFLAVSLRDFLYHIGNKALMLDVLHVVCSPWWTVHLRRSRRLHQLSLCSFIATSPWRSNRWLLLISSLI